MIRKGIVYRRLWYVRKRNSGRIHVMLRLSAALLILASSFMLFINVLLPWLRQAAELDIREAYVAALYEAADRVFSHGAVFKDMLVFESAAGGGITAMSLDPDRLGELTEELLHLTDVRLGLPGPGKVRVSMVKPGSVFFRPGGILDFDVSIKQDAGPDIDYIPEYIPINEGQTKLKITLAVNTAISYKGSFLEGKTVISTELPATEFLILGKLPER